MLTDEIGLGRRFAAGEPDSVAEAYRCYGALVYAVAYRVLGDAGAAEDACQLTFVQAWQNAASFDPSRRLGPWLATIAGRAAIDVYRLNRRHRDHSKPDSLAAPEQGTSPGPSAEQIYDVWEVRRAVDALGVQDRELIRLQHFRDFTHAEIAACLAVPLGTVKSRSFRAHRRLAGLLAHLREGAGPVHR